MSTVASTRAGSSSGAIAVSVLVTTGGVAALSWETLWQLRASLAFGASAFGTALTLAITMAGMTAGSLVMGKRLQRTGAGDPIRLYGWLELVIGLSGLVMLPGFAFLEWLDGRIYSVIPGAAPALNALGVVALLGPPTFAMGATIPTFQLMARRHGVRVSTLYSLNTAGAALGTLALAFVVMPALGVTRTAIVVSAVNVLVFTVAMRLGARAPAAAVVERRSAPVGRPSFAVAQLVVFVTGLVTFALEVAWFRSLRAAFWSTSATFAIMLASVLVPLALGARLVPLLRRYGLGPGAALGAAAVSILLATPLVERMDLFADVPGSYLEILGSWLGLSLAIVGPPMLFLGMALPWCLEEFPEPGRSGRLYGLNTLGAVVGALGAAWILLPSIGFARTAWISGGLVLVVSLVASLRHRRVGVAVTGAAAMVVAVAFTSSPGISRAQGYRTFHGLRVRAHEEGPDSTVSVIEASNGKRMLMIDGFAASGEQTPTHYMQWMGRLPVLLHERPESGLVICFGTGQTADAARQEGLERLDIVELSRAVIDMAPLFTANNRVLEDPRVGAFVMDGRAWLRRTDRRYDIVTLEPMPPNFAGVNSLYSREFYEILSERLNPGGIATQWLPFHLVSPHHSASIAAAFHDVFPESVLWIDPVSTTGILLGRVDAEGAPPLGSEWPGLVRRTLPRTLSDDEVRRGMLLGPEELAIYGGGGDVITDDNQILSFGKIHAGFRGKRSRRFEKVNLDAVAEVADRPVFRLNSERMRTLLADERRRATANR